MQLAVADAAIFAWLEENAPGTVSVREIAGATGLRRVTVEAALMWMHAEGIICNDGTGDDGLGGRQYLIDHVHSPDGLEE